MHPALRAKYGLRTDEDVAIAEHLIANAKRSGISDAAVARVLEYHGSTLVPAFEAGRLDADGAMQLLWGFASQQGIPAEERDAMRDWHSSARSHLEKHGTLPELLAAPEQQATAAELADIEGIARDDPSRYWRDEALQHRMYDLIEQTHAEPSAGPQASKADQARLAEIEASMYGPNGTPNPAYWGNEAAQAEYRNILNLGAPDAGVVGAQPAAAGGGQQQGGTT